VLEAVFILLEPLSPSRRFFIGSHSLPLSGLPYRSFINTNGGFVENMIGMLVSSITNEKTFINLGCKL
jgi:hypothetical protein